MSDSSDDRSQASFSMRGPRALVILEPAWMTFVRADVAHEITASRLDSPLASASSYILIH